MADILTRMADGTLKQHNPFTGTVVQTVPRRGNRPLPPSTPDSGSITNFGYTCAFCKSRVLGAPPKKSRILSSGEIVRGMSVDGLADPQEFRRVPNLFEIVSYAYQEKNYDYQMPGPVRERMERYMADPARRAHTQAVLRGSSMNEDAVAERAPAFFGGGHDLILGRRHYLDGATDKSQLAWAGSLTPEEHSRYWMLTIDVMQDLYQQNRYVAYVQIFQNRLKPAGASFDHLHKQLVSIDERTVNQIVEIERMRANPNLYNESGVDYAAKHNLAIAENDGTVTIVSFGHRYPTLEMWSWSSAIQPREHAPGGVRHISDPVHAMHAATGGGILTNGEQCCAPIDTNAAMPWRILLKWRVPAFAGFEGGTEIYVNTIDPWTLRDKVVPRLLDLCTEGKLVSGINIAIGCSCRVNSLKYNPYLHHR